jgi:hypothetical protein
MRTKPQTNGDPNGAFVRFSPPSSGAPEHLLVEAEIPISAGPLAGLKVTGIRVWRKREDGALFVSFPAKQYRGNGKERYWEYLRASDGKGETASAVRELILGEYHAYLERDRREHQVPI